MLLVTARITIVQVFPVSLGHGKATLDRYLFTSELAKGRVIDEDS